MVRCSGEAAYTRTLKLYKFYCSLRIEKEIGIPTHEIGVVLDHQTQSSPRGDNTLCHITCSVCRLHIVDCRRFRLIRSRHVRCRSVIVAQLMAGRSWLLI